MAKPGPDPKISDDDLMRIIRNDHRPVVGTKDIAQKAHISQQAISRRIGNLVEGGYVATDKVGNTRIYWLTQAGMQRISD